MVPIVAFRAKLNAEQNFFKLQPATEYVKGVLLGISIARRLADETNEIYVKQEEKRNAQMGRDPFFREFYRTLWGIQARLMNGNKKAAMDRIARLIAKYKGIVG